MICPHCGKNVKEYSAFCPKCGQKISTGFERNSNSTSESDLPRLRFCKKCGRPCREGMTLCSNCMDMAGGKGHPIKERSRVIKEPFPRRPFRPIILIILLLIAALGIGIILHTLRRVDDIGLANDDSTGEQEFSEQEGNESTPYSSEIGVIGNSVELSEEWSGIFPNLEEAEYFYGIFTQIDVDI